MSIGIDLSGKVALVTGAASGMGTEISRTLAEAGARVALGDIDEARLAEHKDVGLPVRLDVTDPASASEALGRVGSELGPVDVLVNNAGIAAKRQGMPFTNQEKSDWVPVLEVNIVGAFVVSREVALQMAERGTGSIVNVSSVSGVAAFQTDPGYSASKAAVINFSKVMAKDLAPDVRVNCVCPGMVLTPFYLAQYEAAARSQPEVAAMTPEEYFDRKAKGLIPMGRGQEPRDIANAVAFLSSDLASNITGQTLNVDGGLVMS